MLLFKPVDVQKRMNSSLWMYSLCMGIVAFSFWQLSRGYEKEMIEWVLGWAMLKS